MSDLAAFLAALTNSDVGPLAHSGSGPIPDRHLTQDDSDADISAPVVAYTAARFSLNLVPQMGLVMAEVPWIAVRLLHFIDSRSKLPSRTEVALQRKRFPRFDW